MFSTSVCLASEHTLALPCLPYSEHDAGMSTCLLYRQCDSNVQALHVPDPRG